MRMVIGPRHRAKYLWNGAAFCHRRHGPTSAIRWLFGERSPIDGPSVQPRRRAGFQTRHRKARTANLVGKPQRAILADTAALKPFFPAK